MGLIASNKGGQDFDPVPAGVHVGVCYSIVDLGTQEFTWENQTTINHQIYITWEIASERIEIDSESKPRAIGKFYTLSTHSKSNLRKDIDNWRGKPLTDEEADAFDVSKLLGKPCMLQVVHKPKPGGGISAKVSGIMALPKGTAVPPQENPNCLYSISDHGTNIPDCVPDWLKDKIGESFEFEAPPLGAKELETYQHHIVEPENNSTAGDDSVPF